MADSAESAVQAAIYTALTADATLMSAVNSSIFDAVPENRQFPYVEIGEAIAVEWDTIDSNGQIHEVTIHVWSQRRGKKQTLDIQKEIYRVLQLAALTLTGHQLILIRFVSSQVMKDPDGVTHHGVQKFRLITEDE